MSKSNWREVVSRVKNFTDAFLNTHDKAEYPNGCAMCVQNGYNQLPQEIRETLTHSKFEFLFKRRMAEVLEERKSKQK